MHTCTKRIFIQTGINHKTYIVNNDFGALVLSWMHDRLGQGEGGREGENECLG